MSVSDISAAAHSPTFREEVRQELVRYLYRQAPSSIFTLIIVSTMLGYALWGTTSHSALVAWLLASYGVCGLRLAQIALFHRRSPPDEEIQRWAVWSTIGSALVGILW